MIKIQRGLAPLLVAAIRDAMRYNKGLVNSETVKDVTDIEEFLLSLGLLEMEVRSQYEKMAADDASMPSYGTLWEPL